MIHLILDAYIEKTKYELKRLKPFHFEMVLLIIFFVLMVVFVILTEFINKLWTIGIIISFISFYILISVGNKKLRRMTIERFYRYNVRLDKLKEILMSFKFSKSKTIDEKDKMENFAEKETWYSAERIKYLIKMCDALNYNNSMASDKSLVFLKTSAFPVLSFAAGVIAEKASLEISLTLAVWALFIILCCFALVKFNDLLNFLFFKSDSREKIMGLKSDLMDLLLRDFPESAELEITEVITIQK